MERLTPSPELLRELDPKHQAVRQVAMERIQKYINGTIRPEAPPETSSER